MLSPKQIGTICLVFSFVFLSTKSFSENLPSNPTCDNATLGVYSGSAALEPDWGANKISIRWYNNNTLITDVTAQESECTYDGTIDVATEPTRTGYNFRGWKVRPQMDFSTLTSLGTGLIGYGKGIASQGDYCLYYDGSWHESYALCKTDANFHELQPQEWKTTFSTGTVYGMAHCSAKSGNHHEYMWPMTYLDDWSSSIAELDLAEGDKKYCWCMATGWQPSGEQTRYSSFATLSWVFRGSYSSSVYCFNDCAPRCSSHVRDGSGFRAALFTTTTNNQ